MANLKETSLRYFPAAASGVNFLLVVISAVLLADANNSATYNLLMSAAEKLEFLFFPNSLYYFVYRLQAETLSTFLVYATAAFAVAILPLSIAAGFLVQRLSRRWPAIIVVVLYFALSVGVEILATRIAFSIPT